MIAYAKTVEEIIGVVVSEILTPIVTLLFALAIILFIWGIVEFLIYSDNEEKKSIGKRHMVWGIIGLAIMIAVNGIVWMLVNFWACHHNFGLGHRKNLCNPIFWRKSGFFTPTISRSSRKKKKPRLRLVL